MSGSIPFFFCSDFWKEIFVYLNWKRFLAVARFEPSTFRSKTWWIRPQDHSVLLVPNFFIFLKIPKTFLQNCTFQDLAINDLETNILLSFFSFSDRWVCYKDFELSIYDNIVVQKSSHSMYGWDHSFPCTLFANLHFWATTIVEITQSEHTHTHTHTNSVFLFFVKKFFGKTKNFCSV